MKSRLVKNKKKLCDKYLNKDINQNEKHLKD